MNFQSASSSDEDGIKPFQNMAEEIKVVMRMRPLNERETNPAFVKTHRLGSIIGRYYPNIMQLHKP